MAEQKWQIRELRTKTGRPCWRVETCRINGFAILKHRIRKSSAINYFRSAESAQARADQLNEGEGK